MCAYGCSASSVVIAPINNLPLEWYLWFLTLFSVIIVTDRETHKSRGFGYVLFTNEEDAKEAMESMAGERGKVCMHFFT